MERRKQKKYCQINQQCFFLDELTQIEWSITKKQINGRAKKQKLGIKNIISITVLNLKQISFNRLSKT